MWSSVLGLALLMALDPVRLGLTLLVISRPRPVQNLLAFWVGSLIVSVPAMLAPLMVVHVTPMLTTFAHDLSTSDTNSTVGHIQIGIGVFALSVAALITVRLSARRRARLSTPDGNRSTLVLDSNTPTAISRLLDRAQDPTTDGGSAIRSAIRRLLRRAYNAWENGSLWVALVIGLGSVPPADLLFALAIIVTSGAAIDTQVSAAIAFIVGMLALVEIILVMYLVRPAKTQAVVRLLHDWARAHRQQVLVAMFAVVGVSLLAQGMASL
jgi:Sap, sulfolipid-1-addressing protein